MSKTTTQIQYETLLVHPIELVWDALTKPQAIAQWCMETDFMPVLGHKFQFRGKKNRFWRGWVDCEVLEVVRSNRLCFSWQSMAHHSRTIVTYELGSESAGTRIRATHSGFDHTHGWFSGWLFRTMVKSGLKRELRDWLPQVLENGWEGNFGTAIDRSK